jgi:LysM repeat protein
MEKPTPAPLVPESGEPRYCPVCGSRVADLATSCLMCGKDLDVEDEFFEEAAQPRFQIPWGGLAAGILTALAFLAVIGWLVRAQILGPSATSTPTLIPTATRPPTLTPPPTATPRPTATNTPVPPQVHQVASGETCISVAISYGVSLDVLVALNAERCGPGGIIRPGDLLLIPAATSTPGPTPTVGPGTPTAAPECPIIHVVQPGEVGLVIADKYGVSFILVATANPQVDFENLPVNQVLQIPCGTPVPTATPTPDPNASPTPVPKYDAPALLSPPDGAILTGSQAVLQWTAVSLLRADELYAVRLRRLDEDRPVESIFTNTTLVRLNYEYAPSLGDPVREYSWEVTVVRSMGVGATGQLRYSAASEPSLKRSLRWLFSPNDATPTVTSGP